MRLTPSWLSATSSESSEEDSDGSETETVSGVTIYHDPVSDRSSGESATEFVPESDSELASRIAEMETPVTVDEIADELIRPARPSVETWASVHERLHEHRLPELHAKGHVEFDAEQGLVDRRTVQLDAATRHETNWFGAVRRLVRLAALVILYASALALSVAAITLLV